MSSIGLISENDNSTVLAEYTGLNRVATRCHSNDVIMEGNVILGGYCAGVPPLPIPNREVKPGCADGTAMQCGRVGAFGLYSSAMSGIKTPTFPCFTSSRAMRFPK